MTASTVASHSSGIRHVFLHDMVLRASIGIYPHEHAVHQRVRINVDLGVDDDTALSSTAVGPDDLARVVDYEQIATKVRSIVGSGHTRLVETLAERIAEMCMEDVRVRTVLIKVEKLDAFADVGSAGGEIERHRKL